jgi:hypothetical protein
MYFCIKCKDEGYVWEEGSPNFYNPPGDYRSQCECLDRRQQEYGDIFYGLIEDIPF